MTITTRVWTLPNYYALPLAAGACGVGSLLSIPVIADVIGKDTGLSVGLFIMAMGGLYEFLRRINNERRRADQAIAEQQHKTNEFARSLLVVSKLVKQIAVEDPHVQDKREDLSKLLAEIEVDIDHYERQCENERAEKKRLAKRADDSPFKKFLRSLNGDDGS